jgi:hypothetical protein
MDIEINNTFGSVVGTLSLMLEKFGCLAAMFLCEENTDT